MGRKLLDLALVDPAPGSGIRRIPWLDAHHEAPVSKAQQRTAYGSPILKIDGVRRAKVAANSTIVKARMISSLVFSFQFDKRHRQPIKILVASSEFLGEENFKRGKISL